MALISVVRPCFFLVLNKLLARSSAFSKVALGVVLLGGGGSLLSSGAAQAQASTPCFFGGATGPACQTGVWYASSPQATDKEIQLITLPTVGSGDIELLWNPIDPPNGYAADLWDVDVDFNPADLLASDFVGLVPPQGKFEYTMRITDPAWTFEDVQLDATGVAPYSVTKQVFSDAFITPINGDLLVPPGPDGPLTLPAISQVWVRDTYSVNGQGSLDNFQNTFRQAPDHVPGPLPILGAGTAFGFSRRLRRRIRLGASARA